MRHRNLLVLFYDRNCSLKPLFEPAVDSSFLFLQNMGELIRCFPDVIGVEQHLLAHDVNR